MSRDLVTIEDIGLSVFKLLYRAFASYSHSSTPMHKADGSLEVFQILSFALNVLNVIVQMWFFIAPNTKFNSIFHMTIALYIIIRVYLPVG